MENNFIYKKYIYKIMQVFAVVNILVGLIFYPVIPRILNYPPESINTTFQTHINPIYYSQQYVFIVFMIIVFNIIFIYFFLNRVFKYYNLNSGKVNIKKILFRIPYTIYAYQLVIPVVFLIIGAITLSVNIIVTAKIVIIIISFLTLASVISQIATKKIIRDIIIQLSNNENLKYNLNHNVNHFKLGLRGSIFLQMIPMFIVALLFTSLIGYSRLVKEKGDMTFNIYKNKLEQMVKGKYYNIEATKIELNNLKYESSNDFWFIVEPNGEIIKENKKDLSRFFLEYMKQISHKYDGHVYEYYGIDEQGAVIKIDEKEGTYYIGIKYEIISVETLVYFMIAFVMLLCINAIILYYFARSLAEDIQGVARSLRDIAKGEDKLAQKLPITSNDEIGELEEAFNEFEEAEQSDHERLVEQERLSSLGQLVGGIAHNLKSPILSIAGAMEGLSDLVDEYDESLENDKVTKEDYKEITTEMKSWIEKVRDYTSYMNDVITTVKDQAVSTNDDRMTNFTVEEVIKRLDIITKHTLNKNHCTLNKDIQIGMNTKVVGDITVLIQVINNLIINSVDAYGGERGNIDLIIKRENNVEDKVSVIKFIIADMAGGIKPEVADKLFRQMYTTKGKKGTGLGLYISLTTIKGKFDGNIVMETEYGKGTKFTIIIPERVKG